MTTTEVVLSCIVAVLLVILWNAFNWYLFIYRRQVKAAKRAQEQRDELLHQTDIARLEAKVQLLESQLKDCIEMARSGQRQPSPDHTDPPVRGSRLAAHTDAPGPIGPTGITDPSTEDFSNGPQL